MTRPLTTAAALAQVADKERRATSAQKERDNRLARAFDILNNAAEAGAVCPTNRDLADMLGYAAPNKASGVVSLLEALGLIKVKRQRRSRVVTIIGTGKSTAAGGSDTDFASGWSEDDDAILMDGISEGLTFGAVARIIHKSEKACALRFHRVAARMGEQAQ